jgi:predicted AlkP superfamily pyrophosphatase or phosphodiesterase
MQPTLVLLVVGLTPRLLGPHTPHLNALAGRGGMRPLRTITPAVTCSVQSTFLTGKLPRDHGIVANGWYQRELSEVAFWKQANHLVQGPKIWDVARQRDPRFTAAKLFWWYNMYSGADWSVTPRPMYPADGRKIPDVYTYPPELRGELNAKLGTFPLFRFWGPLADLSSSRWITDSALTLVEERRPTLSLVYLPHLDYCLQRLGPNDPAVFSEVRAVDALCGELTQLADSRAMSTVVLSEYGITEVSGAIALNRVLREHGYLSVREELGLEQLDAGASRAFAVVDHQLAHIYVRDPGDLPKVRQLLEGVAGVETILDRQEQASIGLDHERSGELVLISRRDQWFSYYFWLDDRRAPDYARTVDIHRKPGYDPAELAFDPALSFPKLRAARRVFARKLGMRNLLDVIGLDPSVVRGSHGRPTDDPNDGPLFITSEGDLLPQGAVEATGVQDLLLRHVFER